jgi:hypothetical protein
VGTDRQIEKQYGKGSIMRLGEQTVLRRPGISTGALEPRPGARRRRLAARAGHRDLRPGVVRQDHAGPARRRRGAEATAASPRSSTPSTPRPGAYARKLGVNLDELLISQPDTGEQALEIAEMLVRSNAVDVVVVDSVAALVPKAEIEGEMGDSHVGLQARLMSPGAAQAHRRDLARRTCHLHQPDPHEDRRDVRQPGDHHGRQRAEVLLVGARWTSAASARSRTATRSSATAPGSRW